MHWCGRQSYRSLRERALKLYPVQAKSNERKAVLHNQSSEGRQDHDKDAPLCTDLLLWRMWLWTGKCPSHTRYSCQNGYIWTSTYRIVMWLVLHLFMLATGDHHTPTDSHALLCEEIWYSFVTVLSSGGCRAVLQWAGGETDRWV